MIFRKTGGVTGAGLAHGRAPVQKSRLQEVEVQATKEKFRNIAQAMISGNPKPSWNRGLQRMSRAIRRSSGTSLMIKC